MPSKHSYPKSDESKALDQKIRELWGDHKCRAIAKILGLTLGQVVGRAFRMGLKSSRYTVRHISPVALPENRTHGQPDPHAMRPPAERGRPPAPSRRATLLAIQYKVCQYLKGDKPYVQCEAKATRGCFCDEHATLCYRKASNGPSEEGTGTEA